MNRIVVAGVMGIGLLLCGCESRPSVPITGPAASHGASVATSTAATTLPTTVSRPEVPRADFVGSQVCRECHREIAETFFEHPMGRSIALIHAASPLENYAERTSFDTADGRRYVVEKRADGVWHHEQFPSSSGELLYDQTVSMDLAIGSGRHGRSYASLRGGRYFQSPIGWYSSSASWDMSPGYRPESHPRFDRLIRDRCLLCHVGRLNPGLGPDTWDAKEPIAEVHIGCERCHGPGASHVERHRAPATFTGTDAIVNPVKLDAVRRDAVCHQCHLQATKTIVRYGRQGSDFRPGDRLSDIWVVLTEGKSETLAITQSEQMLSSRCYRASDGRLGCISCHDPHALPKGDPAAHFDARCARCHGATDKSCSLDAANRADQTCIGCHLPRFSTSNIPHMALTDHRILRTKSSAENKAVAEILPTSSPISGVLDEGLPAIPDWEIDRARAFSALRLDPASERTAREITRAAETLRKLEPLLHDDAHLAEIRGWLARRQNDVPGTERAIRRTLELQPENRDAEELLLQVLIARRDWLNAEQLCRGLIKKDDRNPAYHTMQAEIFFRQGKLEESVAAAEESLKFDPTQLAVRGRLIEAHQQAGHPEKAREHAAVLRAMTPRRP